MKFLQNFLRMLIRALVEVVRLLLQACMFTPVFIITPVSWAMDKEQRSIVYHWNETVALYHNLWS